MQHGMKFSGVGPAPSLAIEYAPRVNVITGDNGLGKTFLLDAAWWALTRTWAGQELRPRRAVKQASISFDLDGSKATRSSTCKYEFSRSAWSRPSGRPLSPGLVLYARVDGGFAVWDPYRNYWREAPSMGVSDPQRPSAFLFNPEDVWYGLGSPTDKRARVCNGLIEDLTYWRVTEKEAHAQLQQALTILSPNPSEQIELGSVIRVPGDTTLHPSIRMPDGEQVPLLCASAGVRRICALAYLLVWAFREHLVAADELRKAPERRIIFLIDEIEAHLHPRWQRVILPALMRIVKSIHGEGETAVGATGRADVQIIATTHSPLVLASLEAEARASRDAMFDLDLVDATVTLTRRPWEPHGDANGWLTSPQLDLPTALSEPAEALLREIDALPEGAPIAEERKADLEKRLRRHFNEFHPFWLRWRDLLAARAPTRKGRTRGAA